MRPRLAVILGALVALLAIGDARLLHAQEAQPTFAVGTPQTIIPYFKYKPQLSPDDLEQQVGRVTYRMDSVCDPDENSYKTADNREVRAEFRRWPKDFEMSGDIINALLKGAAEFAWQSCPHPRSLLGISTHDFYYNLSRVRLYGPRGFLAASATLGSRGGDGYGDGTFGSNSSGYAWYNYTNEIAAWRAQTNASPRDMGLIGNPYWTTETDAENRIFFRSIIRVIKYIIGLAILIYIFGKRDAIARFFYSLKPHPATNIVNRALYSGDGIDGEIYAQILSPVPGGKIEREVRGEQAGELTRRLREHEAALRSTEARHVDAIKRRAEQENAFREAHLALLRAGIDHEVAAARIDELRKAMQKS